MKPPRLLNFLRNTSYVLGILVAIFAVYILISLWISKPYPVNPPGTKHVGVTCWKFKLTFMGAPDGLVYRGGKNDSIFLSDGEVDLCVGQEGTPPSLLTFLKWRAVTSCLVFTLAAIIMVLFGRLFDSIGKGQAFSLKCVSLIRLMGWCCIFQFALTSLVSQVLYHLIAIDFPFQQLGGSGSSSGVFVRPQNPGLEMSTVFFGLFAFALAEVFRQGLLLKQDNDLTV
jgi:hypothetical protein